MLGLRLLSLVLFVLPCAVSIFPAHAQFGSDGDSGVKGLPGKSSLSNKDGFKKIQFTTVPFFDTKISDADVANFKKQGVLATRIKMNEDEEKTITRLLNRVSPSSAPIVFLRPIQLESVSSVLSRGFNEVHGQRMERSFALNLSEKQTVLLSQTQSTKRGEYQVWTGTAQSASFNVMSEKLEMRPQAPAILIARGNRIEAGVIYTRTGIYNVFGLKNGLIAVRRVDPSKFFADHPRPEQQGSSSFFFRKVSAVLAAQGGTPASMLRIAVAYTPAAADYMLGIGDGQTLVPILISQEKKLQRAFATIGISTPVKFEIVRVDYKEKSNIKADRDCLLQRTDDMCKAVVDHKTALGTTLLVMVRSGIHGGCGLAHSGEDWKDPAQAVAVVGVHCITNGQEGLLHEIGHLFGAQHDDGGGTSFPFARGYVSPDATWGTLMAVMPVGGRARLPYFSQHGKTVPETGNTPLGDTKRDNAKVVSSTIGEILKFK